MMRRRALATGAVLAACGFAMMAPPSAPALADDPSVVTISGAGPQGRWFKLASLYAKILDREIEEVSFNGVIGKGISIGNLKRVDAGAVEAGFIHFYHLANAREGTGVFADDENGYENVRVWFNMDENFVRVIADAQYDTLADLQGKTISIGVRGSGDDEQCLILLNAHGLTEDNTDFVYTTRNDATQGLINQQLDGLCNSFTRNNRGHLGPLFSAREIGEDVDFVEPDMDTMEEIVANHPQFFVDCEGEPAFERPELCGLAYAQGAVVHKDLSADLVHRMTQVLFENWDEVKEQAPWMEKHPGPEKAASIGFLPYHPGAEQFYKEVGAWEQHHSR